MSGVGAVVCRNPEARVLRQSLNVVVPSHCRLHAFQAREQNMPHAVPDHELPLLVRQIPRPCPCLRIGPSAVGSLSGPGRKILVGAVQHQSCNVLYGKAACQILRPFSGREPPVLIGRQLPRPQKILEGQAVPADYIYPALLGNPQRSAALILYQDITVLFRFLIHNSPLRHIGNTADPEAPAVCRTRLIDIHTPRSISATAS